MKITKRTQSQIDAWKISMSKKPLIPWNKGKSYIHKSKGIYANKGSWNMAMRRIYPNKCMRCGWEESVCDTHHIVPKSDGGEYTLENGIILCPNCHRLADFEIVNKKELFEIKVNL